MSLEGYGLILLSMMILWTSVSVLILLSSGAVMIFLAEFFLFVDNYLVLLTMG